MTRRYRLADPEARVPMPDRGGRLFKHGEKGEAIDPESRFYATLIAEGGIIPVLTPRTGRSATCGSEGARDDARSAVAAAPAAKTKRTTRKEVSPSASRGAPEASPLVAPAGRATTRGGRSASRASPERTPEAKRKRT